MEILLKRMATYKQGLHGRLYIDGEHVCDTLERVDDCLPLGTYPLHFSKVEGIVRKQLMIGRSARFVTSNGPYTLPPGCIAIGEWKHLGFLIRCGDYFEPLMERMRKALGREREIIIKN